MKKLLSLVICFSLCFTLLPSTSFAIETNDKELEKFLQDIGWEKEAYISYLTSKGWTLEDFYSIDELGTPLSEESIQPVLIDFELTREELNELLIENGDIDKGQDVLDGEYLIFSEELYDFVDFYINGEFGTPIDEQNLQELLTKYGFASKEELEAFLINNNDSLDDYEYIEDLDYMIDLYKNGLFTDEEIFGLFDEIGLTEAEIENLLNHLEKLDFEDPTVLDRLLILSDRMIAFEEFESADELTAEQISELLSIFTELLDIFQIDIQYYLVKDGQKEQISINNLLSLQSTNGADLLLEIYSKEGQFLADILFTAEMFGSEVIKETGKDLQEAKEIIAKTADAKKTVKKPQTIQTVKGAKLPKTAANYVQNILIGTVIMIAGLFLLQRSRKKEI